jgi:hypothetical protein
MVVGPNNCIAVVVRRADIFYPKQRGRAFRLYFILSMVEYQQHNG